MNTIKAFLYKIASVFRSNQLQVRLAQAYNILKDVLPVVEEITALTPTRADDEIVALIWHYVLPPAETPMTDQEKADYLKNTAVTVVKRELSQAGVPDSVIALAVELAVQVVKAR
jgi:hypothetical protein